MYCLSWLHLFYFYEGFKICQKHLKNVYAQSGGQIHSTNSRLSKGYIRIKYLTSDSLYVNCNCDCNRANSTFILQISHAKTFKMRYTRCQFNNPIQRYSQLQFMCGSKFYETDVMKVGHYQIVTRNKGKYYVKHFFLKS